MLKRTLQGLLAAGTVIAALGLAACGSTAQAPSGAGGASTGAQPAQGVTNVNMTIQTDDALNVPGCCTGKPNWPRYLNASWSVKAGDTVHLKITSWEDGASPLPGSPPYTQVIGTVGGTELVNGKAVHSVPTKQVAHTLTVPGLGLNLVIPVAPKGKTIVVEASFQVPKAGTYYWQCEAPCGTTASGWGGPMETPGWMQGTITVTA